MSPPRGDRRPETLLELLDAHHIELHEAARPGRQHGGSRSKIFCPQCWGGQEKEKNFYVLIDPDGAGATWTCFRANKCGFSGGGRIANSADRPQEPPRQYRRPRPLPADPSRPASLFAYFASFGVPRETVDGFNIYAAVRQMPVLDSLGKQTDERRERTVIAYPYIDDGELVNCKYKALYKIGDARFKRFSQEKDPRPSLFNVDAIVDPETDVIFVEGEDDVLVLAACGFPQVTTLADGSPTKLGKNYSPETDDDRRYEAIRNEPRLAKAKRIILAGDMDEAGRRHHEEIARRLGKERCWEVRWPRGCKDAKDTRRERGADAVVAAIDGADPYPLEGVEVPDEEALLNLHQGIHGRRFTTGYQVLDDRVSLTDEGQLIITTGVPGHGKTAFWNAMAVLYTERTAKEMKDDHLIRPFHTVMYSAETRNHRLIADLVSQCSHQPFFPHSMVPRVSQEAVSEKYLPWVRRHFTFLKWPDRTSQPPVSWVLAMAANAIKRTGAPLFIMDPWQEFDDEIPEREHNHSRWVGKVLQKMIGMSLDLKVNTVLVVHPQKLKRDRDGKFPVPTGYDIGDSQNFYSRPDIGLTIHRPTDNGGDMLIRTWKSKYREVARFGDTTVRFDATTLRLWPKLAEAPRAAAVGDDE